jgi:iron(III) transport system ATP-binding protein
MRVIRIYNANMFLTVTDLEVRHPGAARAAVAGLSFALPAGEVGVLIGPSGCGKTTLLRAVAGLERATAGCIELAGALVSGPGTAVPPEQRLVGMVFQDFALFPHLTVQDNVAFGIHQLPAAERAARVRVMLQLVDLPELAQRYPHELSGGQQQRVALARALAPRPRLLLLDEPFSSLDVDLREHLAHELRGILKRAGATALLVTHDQQEAFAMGDVIGVMHEGRLHQWGDAYTLYHRPRTRFVADFIGHGVLAPARAVQRAGLPVLETLVGDLPLPPEGPPPATSANGECDVLLRADDIVHDDASPVQAQIVRKAFRGAEFLYTLRTALGQPLMALVPSHHDHAVGEHIGIRVHVDHVVTFPRLPF